MSAIVFSSATIQSWVFCLFLCVVAPLCFLWYLKKKTGAKVGSFFVGIAFSLLFSFIAGVFLNIIILQVFGLGFLFGSANHPVYSALYGAVTAGLLACIGSYVGLKYAMNNRTGKDNALLFGLGKGGFECIMNSGTVTITNLIAAVFINSIGSNEYLKKLNLSAAELEKTHSSFAALAAIPGYTFIINSTYYLLILCVHASLALLIYQALKKAEDKHFILIAFILQIISYIPLYLTNLPWLQNSLVLLSIAFLYTFGVVYFAYQLYQKLSD